MQASQQREREHARACARALARDARRRARAAAAAAACARGLAGPWCAPSRPHGAPACRHALVRARARIRRFRSRSVPGGVAAEEDPWAIHRGGRASAAGEDVLLLGMGVPDTPTSPAVRAAAAAALDAPGGEGYAPAMGDELSMALTRPRRQCA